jgi:surface antigen
MKRLQEEQRKQNQASLGGRLPSPTGGTGGYPYVQGWVGGVGGFSPLVDAWGFYYQQCTSYVAWKIYDSGKNMPAWGRMYASANARDWPSFTSNKGSDPRKGAAAVMTGGTYGHVMYVEEVYGNGQIRVSDYNLGFDGAYRTYDRSASGLVYIYF